MLPPCDDLTPSRSWDELIETSRRRGVQLRRRRRAMSSAPVLAVLAAVVAVTALHGGSSGRESLVPAPVATRPVQPDPRPVPEDETVDAPAAPQLPTAPTSDAAQAAPPAAAAPPGVPRPQPRRDAPQPVAGPTTAPVPAAPSLPTVVAYTDPEGDGYAHADPDGSIPAGSESDPAQDIVAMTFAAEPHGLRVTMDLAGPRSADTLYYAYTTDQVSGCRLIVAFAVHENQDEGFFLHCPDGQEPITVVPRVNDPSPDRLDIVVPYELFPDRIPPERPLSRLYGETRPQRAGMQLIGDTARTDRTLSGRRR